MANKGNANMGSPGQIQQPLGAQPNMQMGPGAFQQGNPGGYQQQFQHPPHFGSGRKQL